MFSFHIIFSNCRSNTVLKLKSNQWFFQSHFHANGVEDSSIVKQKKGHTVIKNINTYSKEPSFRAILVNSRETLFDKTLYIFAELHKGKKNTKKIFSTPFGMNHTLSRKI